VALAGAHAGEQTAAALVLAATGGGAAGILRWFAASGLAALAAKQTGGRFLILAHHGESHHGDQHGDRPHHDTIHLGISSHVETGKQKCTHKTTAESPLSPGRLDGLMRGWVDALCWTR
jgi:hypothetical protein